MEVDPSGSVDFVLQRPKTTSHCPPEMDDKNDTKPLKIAHNWLPLSFEQLSMSKLLKRNCSLSCIAEQGDKGKPVRKLV